MKTITQGEDWQLIEREGISYYVHAKFVEGSWTGYIECRSCPDDEYRDESFPHDTAEQAIQMAINKSRFHHELRHGAKSKKI